MPGKSELEAQIKALKQELIGVKSDCGILLEENNKLIDALEEINPQHPVLKQLFSAQWRADYKTEIVYDQVRKRFENKQRGA